MFCNYFSNTLRAGLELWVKTVFSSISLVLSAVKITAYQLEDIYAERLFLI